MFSTAGTKTLISPVKVPVNSITLLDASASGSASAVVKVTSALPATLFAKYPAPKLSTTSKLLFVLVPQTLAFAPVSLK